MIRKSAYKRSWIEGKGLFAFSLLIASILWLAGYLDHTTKWASSANQGTFFWNAFIQYIPSPTYGWMIGFGVLSIISMLIQQSQYTLSLIREKSALPFFFFIFFTSCNPYQQGLAPQMIGAGCFVLSLYQLFCSYHNETDYGKAFNWGFLLAIATFIWAPILWLTPLFWYGMYHLRSFSGRSFMASLIGLLTPYWLILGVCVWTQNYVIFNQIATACLSFDLNGWDGDLYGTLSLVAIIILTLIASIHILMNEFRDNERTRQYLSLTFIFAIYTLILSFIFETQSNGFILISAVPSSILIAHFFTVNWKRWTRILFILMVVYFLIIFFLRLWRY